MVETNCCDLEDGSRQPLLGYRTQEPGGRHWPNFGTMHPSESYETLQDNGSGKYRHLNAWKLLCLTVSMGGLQTIWTSIMAQGSPYLASLGMRPAIISLVWLSGPLSGMFIQPYIGVLSDSCTFRWGRRKTFIIFGTLATSIFMIALPWTSNTVESIYSCLGGNPMGRNAVIVTQFVAAMTIWGLKMSLQPVQCGIRALIVDYCPEDQQHQASAYASRAIGVGSILGYGSGFVDFPSVFPSFGNTQFQVLCVICCIALVSTVVLQCMVIHEKQLDYDEGIRRRGDLGLFGPLKQVFLTAETMPKRIRKICVVQFFSWLSWFSFMYYITTYIGDLYSQEYTESLKITTIDATRLGTIAMLAFATSATLVNLGLPRFIKLEKANSTQSLLAKRKPVRDTFTLPRAWLIANTLAAISFLLLGMTRSRSTATVLIAVLGISWALTQWAPFALIGEELAKSRQQPRHNRTLKRSDVEKGRVDIDETNQTALILGLHNLAISAPQILASVGSSIVFWGLERIGIVGTDAIGWLLMFGMVPAGAAAWWAWAVENDDIVRFP